MYPSKDELGTLFQRKHAPIETAGWGPKLRRRFGYYGPDDVYEALLCRLVGAGTSWLDVGCGRDIFPSNEATARYLANRCRLLTGLDPSDNIDENEFVHRSIKSTIEDLSTKERFDLVTLRMVAEHISEPDRAVAKLASVLRDEGRIVIYTVHKWAPVSMVSAAVPFRLHHAFKRVFWGTEEKDTFPVAYLLNTRRDLRRVMEAHGLREEFFSHLDDCRTFARWPALSAAELMVWRVLNSLRLHYPETCLLGVYKRAGIADHG